MPQPAPLGATHRVLATWAARKRLRSSGDAMETEQAQSATPAAATVPPVFVQATPRMSVSVILTALGASKPFVDASGERLPDSLLGRTFESGLDALESPGMKWNLLQAASAVVFHALSALAPDPLATAAALAQPKRASSVDRLRLTLAEPHVPTGRSLLELIANSDVAKSLLHSYVSAQQRKEKMAVKAQILAPFTAQYSLRLFNQCFELQLANGGGPVTRYGWHYAKWHAAIWLSGQTAAVSRTEKWQLRGTGDLGTLPNAKIVTAVEFLTSGEYLQHVAHGTRRVKTDAGWHEFSQTERTQCKEALWRVYQVGRETRLQLGRSLFLKLADLVAGSDQKSYGALDTFAEHNGRASRQSGCVATVMKFASSSLTCSSSTLPASLPRAPPPRERVEARRRGGTRRPSG